MVLCSGQGSALLFHILPILLNTENKPLVDTVVHVTPAYFILLKFFFISMNPSVARHPCDHLSSPLLPRFSSETPRPPMRAAVQQSLHRFSGTFQRVSPCSSFHAPTF